MDPWEWEYVTFDLLFLRLCLTPPDQVIWTLQWAEPQR